jgi:glutamate racemase
MTQKGECAMRIAVMAGTVVDTAMGVEFLRQKGLEALGCPISRTAGEQMAFQVLPLEQRMARLRQVFGELQADGVTAVFVYCNSLSSVADFDGLAAEFSMTVVTPLQCYRAVAARHDKVAVLAANCQSLAGIEKELYRGNGAVDIFGMAMLPLVQAIEANIPPEDLVEQFALAGLLRTFARCGAQCLILGCTHFPYLKDALARLDLLPLFDPAEAMVQRLV